ncbi:MAG: response regulator [Patescibacteria group bacterium]
MAEQNANTQKVLIIEDDKFLRDLIQQKLNKEGFLTVVASDGEEGVRVAQSEVPHLVLLDLILPGIDGFEVLKQLKGDQKTSSIPVIVLSNLGQKEDMERTLKNGAEDFMVKAHFTPNEIVTKVRATLKAKYF